MSVNTTHKERIIKNELRISYIKEQLNKFETQIAEAKELSRIGNDRNMDIQNFLVCIDGRIQKLEASQKTQLKGRDKATIYGGLLALVGLILAEIIRSLV
ncbi:MAG: hypothetical protein LBI79_03830 [Nitrososphaerota archaeon]|jgi:hypothetical protein|nr:hypothetical protein [Nitrososphaerota archaeon]